MGLVVCDLLDASAFRLAHGFFHGLGDAICIQDGAAVEIARRAANSLDQAALCTQEAFLVRIEDGHQRHLGNVEPFAQQIDTHKHIKRAQAQVTNDLHALDRVHIAVQVAHLHAVVGEVVGQLLGHALGERGDEYSLVLFCANAYFLKHIIHLVRGRAHLDHRVHQPCGPHHLVHDLA